MQITIDVFKRLRPISNLDCFSLKYYRDYAKLKKELIKHKKKFAILESKEGKKYCVQKDIVFYKIFNDAI